MSTFSGLTAQDPTWKTKEQSEEAVYVKEKERAQLEALRKDLMTEEKHTEKVEQNTANQEKNLERDFEGGFGGQEDLEDRYATTSGEH
ncbi:hypothetical protein Clacol_006264 [Clathrus columnatus]|uniref:ATPase inhibitor, mitochondrial n=1 Tax=Clathrus columnatus TaxID=1419009 RepID=A0AAV5AH67_9AGAM|nr:hypothetical protein Clacol_006264 [Clathrus columnatus]